MSQENQRGKKDRAMRNLEKINRQMQDLVNEQKKRRAGDRSKSSE